MKRFLVLLALSCFTAGIVAPTAEAARRLGSGSNVGKQRSTPAVRQAQREAPKAAPAAAPAQPAPAAQPAAAAPAPTAAPVPPVAQPKPSFMSRWGGVIAGVGVGALLGSMLGGNLGGLGSAIGGLLNILLIAGVLYFVYRFFASRRRAAMAAAPMQFIGAGGPSMNTGSFRTDPVFAHDAKRPVAAEVPADTAVPSTIDVPPGFEIESFVRQAQSSFLRLQAANDDRDLADLRETTTPEVYAELAMQIRERGDAPQKTDIVKLDAQLLEVVVEGEQMVASLRYSGLVREATDAPAVPFDEVWHLRRSATAANDPWVIAGIQQMG